MRLVLPLIMVLALWSGDARAQGLGPTDRTISIAIVGGGISPTAKFADGSRFERGESVGLALTLWPTKSIGFRASAIRARTGTNEVASPPLAGEDPTISHYSLDLIGEPPAPWLNQWGWSPYLLGGIGIKSYSFRSVDYLKRTSDFAAQLGGGVEYRLGRVGFQVEARGVFSPFKHLGYSESQRDLVYTAGLTLNL